jgi:hypothetical protein
MAAGQSDVLRRRLGQKSGCAGEQFHAVDSSPVAVALREDYQLQVRVGGGEFGQEACSGRGFGCGGGLCNEGLQVALSLRVGLECCDLEPRRLWQFGHHIYLGRGWHERVCAGGQFAEIDSALVSAFARSKFRRWLLTHAGEGGRGEDSARRHAVGEASAAVVVMRCAVNWA